MICTRCDGTGFLNIDLLPPELEGADPEDIQDWLQEHPESDTQVCDCCGNGEEWYGEPGNHYGENDPPGHGGPYADNGGYCKCH